ncbi:MAG: hypothetical protein JNL67_06965 [Planctomycetaceae bacterium]|nr:hypothetical protein [Planctomycetaceae bacterium]
MKQFVGILASLVVGTILLFTLIWAGLMVTLVVSNKSTNLMVWNVGSYYIPFFIGGFILARTRGLGFARIIIPLCALLAVLLWTLLMLVTSNFETSELLTPRIYLPYFAIPCAFVGCVIGQISAGSTANPRK